MPLGMTGSWKRLYVTIDPKRAAVRRQVGTLTIGIETHLEATPVVDAVAPVVGQVGALGAPDTSVGAPTGPNRVIAGRRSSMPVLVRRTVPARSVGLFPLVD